MIYGGNASNSLDDLQRMVNRTVQALMPHRRKFDSIIVQGMSGVVVGVPVALALHKPVVIVRKEGESHHSGHLIVNQKRIGKRWLFLDDFVWLGITRKRVTGAVEVAKYPAPRYVGSYLYLDGHLDLEPYGHRERICETKK